MPVRLFEQLSSLGDTIQRGAAQRGQHELDMAKLGLQEKQIGAELANRDRDYAMRLAADERAKQDQAMQQQNFEMGLPAQQLAKDKAILEQEMRSKPVFVKDLIGESKTATELAYWADKDGTSWIDDIKKITGAKIDTDETSPYAGALIGKNGKPLTQAEIEQYIPQIEASLKVRTDPERWVQGEARRLQEKFDKKQIDEKTYTAEKTKLAKLGSDEMLLKAYQAKNEFLAPLPGQEGQKARDRNEAKIKEVMSRIEEKAKEQRGYAQEEKIARIKAKEGRDNLGLKQKDLVEMYKDANKYAKDKFELMYPADTMGKRYITDKRTGEAKELTQTDSEKVFDGFKNEYLKGLGFGSPEPAPAPKADYNTYKQAILAKFPDASEDEIKTGFKLYNPQGGLPSAPEVSQVQTIQLPKATEQKAGIPKNIDMSWLTSSGEDRAKGKVNTLDLRPDSYLAQKAQEQALIEAIEDKKRRRALAMVK